MPQALTKVSHQIFSGWEVQTMWSLKKHVLAKKKKKKENTKKKTTYKWTKINLPL